MSKVNWQAYLKWREAKGLNNADVAIFVGKEVSVKSHPVLIAGESLVQVQVGDKANLLVPWEMVSEE